MQRMEVWDYWYEISRCGPKFDEGATTLRKP
jgi:hypothetical protein